MSLDVTEAETRLAVNAALDRERLGEPQTIFVPHDSPLKPELPPEDRKVAERLAGFNHRSRNKYWALRRKGVPEETALEAIWRALPR